MTTSTLAPAILSAAKNPGFMVISTQNSRFFAALRMPGVEVFGINK